MKQYLKLASGQIAYQSYGNGSRDMIVFHGLMGSSWLDAEWIAAIEGADVRCIVLERPGYGDSSPIHMERVADWAELFEPVVEALQIQDAVAVGCSAGAVYAYASAFAAPAAIGRVWILDGVPAVYLDRVMRHYNSEARQAYATFLNATLTSTQDYYVAGLDDFLATLPENSNTHLRNTLIDARANRCFGPAQESRLQITPWGFEPTDIPQPVTLWHARGDTMVPYGVAPEMADMLKDATLLIADPDGSGENDSDIDVHIGSITRGFLHLLGNCLSR